MLFTMLSSLLSLLTTTSGLVSIGFFQCYTHRVVVCLSFTPGFSYSLHHVIYPDVTSHCWTTCCVSLAGFLNSFSLKVFFCCFFIPHLVSHGSLGV